MPILDNAEIYKILVGIIIFLLGILNLIGQSILNNLKKNDIEIFKRLNDNEKELAELKGEHKALCDNHNLGGRKR